LGALADTEEHPLTVVGEHVLPVGQYPLEAAAASYYILRGRHVGHLHSVIASSGGDVVLGGIIDDITVGHVVDAIAACDGIGPVAAAHEVIAATADQDLLAAIEGPESRAAGDGVVTGAA
jgi:hypothetical protein